VFPVLSVINVPAGATKFSFTVTAGAVTTATLVQVTASYYGTTSIATVQILPPQQ
jgi:hypothetical protein